MVGLIHVDEGMFVKGQVTRAIKQKGGFLAAKSDARTRYLPRVQRSFRLVCSALQTLDDKVKQKVWNRSAAQI